MKGEDPGPWSRFRSAFLRGSQSTRTDASCPEGSQVPWSVQLTLQSGPLPCLCPCRAAGGSGSGGGVTAELGGLGWVADEPVASASSSVVGKGGRGRPLGGLEDGGDRGQSLAPGTCHFPFPALNKPTAPNALNHRICRKTHCGCGVKDAGRQTARCPAERMPPLPPSRSPAASD